VYGIPDDVWENHILPRLTVASLVTVSRKLPLLRSLHNSAHFRRLWRQQHSWYFVHLENFATVNLQLKALQLQLRLAKPQAPPLPPTPSVCCRLDMGPLSIPVLWQLRSYRCFLLLDEARFGTLVQQCPRLRLKPAFYRHGTFTVPCLPFTCGEELSDMSPAIVYPTPLLSTARPPVCDSFGCDLTWCNTEAQRYQQSLPRLPNGAAQAVFAVRLRDVALQHTFDDAVKMVHALYRWHELCRGDHDFKDAVTAPHQATCARCSLVFYPDLFFVPEYGGDVMEYE
jgi:hypothetical protein